MKNVSDDDRKNMDDLRGVWDTPLNYNAKQLYI
ncbi:MAG: hypothetical protein ACKPKO_62275 [Candidatus Fonsibacter sp.]